MRCTYRDCPTMGTVPKSASVKRRVEERPFPNPVILLAGRLQSQSQLINLLSRLAFSLGMEMRISSAIAPDASRHAVAPESALCQIGTA